jgi:hypothetical protein
MNGKSTCFAMQSPEFKTQFHNKGVNKIKMK